MSAGSDDAEEGGSGGVMVTSSDLELVNDGSLQTVGVRFRGVTIPRGSIISSAWVQFQADEAQSEATALAIQGEASDNAAIFTAASRSISTRARTVESVAWTPALYDVQGRRLRTLLDERNLAAGRHQIELGERLTPGLYFYRVQAPDRKLTGRVMVLE